MKNSILYIVLLIGAYACQTEVSNTEIDNNYNPMDTITGFRWDLPVKEYTGLIANGPVKNVRFKGKNYSTKYTDYIIFMPGGKPNKFNNSIIKLDTQGRQIYHKVILADDCFAISIDSVESLLNSQKKITIWTKKHQNVNYQSPVNKNIKFQKFPKFLSYTNFTPLFHQNLSNINSCCKTVKLSVPWLMSH